MSRLALTGWLVVAWVAMWGKLSLANVLSGVVVAVALLAVFPVHQGEPWRYVLRPRAIARFVGYFLVQLIASNVTLAREVLSRRGRVRTGIIAVPMEGVSDGLLTLVANVTALTPGTMTIEVGRDPAVLYVHVLLLYDIESVRAGIRKLERLAIEAFGSPEAVASLADHGPAEGTG